MIFKTWSWKCTRSNSHERNEGQNVYDTNIDLPIIKALFPPLGVIIKDLFDLYITNKPRLKRNIVFINYIIIILKMHLIKFNSFYY